MRRVRRWGALVLVGAGAAFLSACNPNAGEGRITITGAEVGEIAGPAVTCPPPGDGGEVHSQWIWEGTFDGEETLVAFAGFYSEVVDFAVLRVGDDVGRYYVAAAPMLPGGPTTVHQERVDEDGTLHATATLVPVPGGGPGGEVHLDVALRCP
jgi:hypothetical protein